MTRPGVHVHQPRFISRRGSLVRIGGLKMEGSLALAGNSDRMEVGGGGGGGQDVERCGTSCGSGRSI